MSALRLAPWKQNCDTINLDFEIRLVLYQRKFMQVPFSKYMPTEANNSNSEKNFSSGRRGAGCHLPFERSLGSWAAAFVEAVVEAPPKLPGLPLLAELRVLTASRHLVEEGLRQGFLVSPRHSDCVVTHADLTLA